MRSVPRSVAAAGYVLLTAGLATACGAGDAVSTTPTTSASATSVPGPATTPPPASDLPDAAGVRAQGTAVVVAGVTVLHVLASGAGTTVHAEATEAHTAVTFDPGGPELPLDVLLAVPDGATLRLQEDESLLVLAGDGTFLGGTAPITAAAGATPPELHLLADDIARLLADRPVSTRVGSAALVRTAWGDREGGRSLAVEPTPWARQAGLAGEAAVWAEVIRTVPEANTPVMYDQLVCHAVGAPDKATWNLEPWRPDVGVLDMMLAACNPT